MSKREYPRLGYVRDMRKKWIKADKNGVLKPVNNCPRCLVCGELAQFITEVQVSWFRGDDESVKTCLAHRNSVDAIAQAWRQQQ